MDPRKFASVFGSSCLAVGLLSLIPALTGSAAGLPALNWSYSYGLFMGLFALNIVNKIALVAVGAWGLTAASAKFNALPRSISYCRGVCAFMLAMGVLGLIARTNTVGGYWPLFGTANVTASLLFAAVSGLFGFSLTSKVPNSGPAVHEFTTPMTSR